MHTNVLELIERAAENAALAAEKALSRFRGFPDNDDLQIEIKQIEKLGDEFTKKIVERLHSADLEPSFAREDLYMLAGAIDDVVDHIEHACELLTLHRVGAAMTHSLEQCEVLVEASKSMRDAVSSLIGETPVGKHVAQVRTSEDRGDDVLREAVRALFADDEINPRTIIQWKDIFEALEDAIDSCEQASIRVANLALERRA